MKAVDDLIKDCKLIVDFYLKDAKINHDKQDVRRALYARINRLSLHGLLVERPPAIWRKHDSR